MRVSLVELKAEEMVNSYLFITDKIGETSISSFDYAKQCALICCEEIITTLSLYHGMHDQSFINADRAYYERVKFEINQL